MPGNLHSDELPIDPAMVRALVDQTMPQYAGLPVRPPTSTGSTNALFRLGDDLLVRLPRQPGGSGTIDKEAKWLPVIGRQLPVAVPQIVAVGEPALGYPERWSVVKWLPGELPLVVNPDAHAQGDRCVLAQGLADVISALRRIEVPADAIEDDRLRWYRGDALATRNADTRQDLHDCRVIPDLGLNLDAALQVWDEAMALPGIDEPCGPHWYHGDLFAENLLVGDGRLAAVLDFGGLAVGDPTVDLVCAWEVLDPPARQVFREALDVDDATWFKGRAWALSIAVMTFPYYWRTMPERCASRLAMARAVLHDAARQSS